MDVLGIDVSKADFHACLLQGEKRARKSFPNSAAGYGQLTSWLRNRKSLQVHVCMEATGAYWLGLATAVVQSGAPVSVVNPSRTAMFARSQLRRTKTDRVDAEMIAEFCKTQQPERWTPPPSEILELRGLLTYRGQLTEERTRLQHIAKQVRIGEGLHHIHVQQTEHLKAALTEIDRQIQGLLKAHESLRAQVAALTAVRGIGLLTAASLVAKLPMDRLRNGKAAAAYIGVTPSERQSGTSVHAKPRICKTGNAGLRRDLYMPALVAMRFNPILTAFAERLKERGKAPKAIIVAVMRKLVVLAYTLLKRLGQPTPIPSTA